MIFLSVVILYESFTADKESDVPFISSEYSNEKDFRLFNDAFNNKTPVVKDLRNHIDKYANEVKVLCVQNLLPVLKNFTRVFVFCVDLGRALNVLVLEGCKKEVIFVDAMFDKFPTKQVDGLEIISPEQLIVLVTVSV